MEFTGAVSGLHLDSTTQVLEKSATAAHLTASALVKRAVGGRRKILSDIPSLKKL